MTSESFFDLLSDRAVRAGVDIPPEVRPQLWDYLLLLTRWNATINLTALPLDPPTIQTIDRLLIEPISAARWAGDFAGRWIDIGSGGGSPAIPFKFLQPRATLTMVESRARKAAYLRDAVRLLDLPGTSVEEGRFENYARSVAPGTVELVTIRAVRIDQPLFSSIHPVLSSAGRVFLFEAAKVAGAPQSTLARADIPEGFEAVTERGLGTEGGDQLRILKPVFHVEQSD